LPADGEKRKKGVKGKKVSGTCEEIGFVDFGTTTFQWFTVWITGQNSISSHVPGTFFCSLPIWGFMQTGGKKVSGTCEEIGFVDFGTTTFQWFTAWITGQNSISSHVPGTFFCSLPIWGFMQTAFLAVQCLGDGRRSHGCPAPRFGPVLWARHCGGRRHRPTAGERRSAGGL
jgi:hypothetical protein